MAFSIGLRLFYLFVPLVRLGADGMLSAVCGRLAAFTAPPACTCCVARQVMWSIGPTALLCSSIGMTLLIAYMVRRACSLLCVRACLRWRPERATAHACMLQAWHVC